MTIRLVMALVALVTLPACGTDDGVEGETTLPLDSPAVTAPSTRAQRDSAIAGSRLPGAGGVRGAMEASESARRRAEATDTMLP